MLILLHFVLKRFPLKKVIPLLHDPLLLLIKQPLQHLLQLFSLGPFDCERLGESEDEGDKVLDLMGVFRGFF